MKEVGIEDSSEVGRDSCTFWLDRLELHFYSTSRKQNQQLPYSYEGAKREDVQVYTRGMHAKFERSCHSVPIHGGALVLSFDVQTVRIFRNGVVYTS